MIRREMKIASSEREVRVREGSSYGESTVCAIKHMPFNVFFNLLQKLMEDLNNFID